MGAIQFRYLTQEQVIAMGGLDMTLAVEDMEELFRLFGSGECILPDKVILRWGDAASEKTRGHINAMPGHVGGRYDMAGIKWIAVMPLNPIQIGQPAIAGLVVLNDPIRGFPVAVMDGTIISAVRTGAVCGVGAKYLARRDARTAGVIGAGAQSRTTLMAAKVARPSLTRALVYDTRPDRTAAWCEYMSGKLGDMAFEVVDSAEKAATRADILISATSSVEPVVKAGWLMPGSLYLQVSGRDCAVEAFPEFDKIVLDNWDAIKHRGVHGLVQAISRGILSEDAITGELGEVVLGRKPGRQNDQERCLFGSVGMGIEDVAVATRILRRAEAEGVGTMLTLWEKPEFV